MPGTLRRHVFGWLALASSLAIVPERVTAESVTRSVAVQAQFASRTSLKVSTELLRFDARAGGTATASVEFSARARTHADAEVLLMVEQREPGPDTATGEQQVLALADGATIGGPAGTTAVAGRWTGSGLRSGTLTFTLRAGRPGIYTIPVQFILSAP